jgi:hypothetical protein
MGVGRIVSFGFPSSGSRIGQLLTRIMDVWMSSSPNSSGRKILKGPRRTQLTRVDPRTAYTEVVGCWSFIDFNTDCLSEQRRISLVELEKCTTCRYPPAYEFVMIGVSRNPDASIPCALPIAKSLSKGYPGASARDFPDLMHAWLYVPSATCWLYNST